MFSTRINHQGSGYSQIKLSGSPVQIVAHLFMCRSRGGPRVCSGVGARNDTADEWLSRAGGQSVSGALGSAHKLAGTCDCAQPI